MNGCWKESKKLAETVARIWGGWFASRELSERIAEVADVAFRAGVVEGLRQASELRGEAGKSWR